MKKLFENWKKFMKEEEQASSNKVDEVSFNTMSAKSVFEDEGEINELQQAQDYTYEVHTKQEPHKYNLVLVGVQDF